MADIDFFKMLTSSEKQLVSTAINTFGDGQHAVATPSTLEYFRVPYVAHCLGRMHYAVIGTKLMDVQDPTGLEELLALNEMHDEVIGSMTDYIDDSVSELDITSESTRIQVSLDGDMVSFAFTCDEGELEIKIPKVNAGILSKQIIALLGN